jgi:hypothetical protein
VTDEELEMAVLRQLALKPKQFGTFEKHLSEDEQMMPCNFEYFTI